MIKNKFKKFFQILFVASLIVAGILVNPNKIVAVEASKTSIMPLLGNQLKNPQLKYTEADVKIPNWRIAATHDVFKGSDSSILGSASGSMRSLVPEFVTKDFSNYKLSKAHGDSDPYLTMQAAYVDGVSSATNPNAAFQLLAQTTTLVANEKYYFRAEIASTGNPANGGQMRVDAGQATSGNGPLVIKKLEPNEDVSVYEQEFVAPYNSQGEVTVSLRQIASKDPNAQFKVYRMGLYSEKDYLVQRDVDKLFADFSHENLALMSDQDFDALVYDLQVQITSRAITLEVKEYVQAEIAKAQKLKAEIAAIKADTAASYFDNAKDTVKLTVTDADIEALQARVDDASPEYKPELQKGVDALKNRKQYQDDLKSRVSGLLPNNDQNLNLNSSVEDIDALKAEVDALSPSAYKDELKLTMDKVSPLRDLKDKVNKLYTDKNQNDVPAPLTKAEIDALRAEVDQVIVDGRDTNDFYKDLVAKMDTAEAMLDVRDKSKDVFTDNNENDIVTDASKKLEELEALRDKLPAGPLVDKVNADIAKAKDMLDKQQEVFDLFEDDTHSKIKDSTNEETLKKAQEKVDSLADGPLKDRLTDLLEVATEEVDKRNQGEADKSVDQLFKDAEHTSLADAVDQAAIDAAQADVDQVKDAAKKAELQKEVDKAQALLDARNAVNDIFTDANHNAVKPETTQAVVDGLKDQVAKLPEGADKAALVAQLDKAQALLDGQKAVDNIFTDATKTAVKPEMTNKDIDDAKALIDKMPEGPAKEAALKDVEKAQGLVDVNNQTGAKTSVDQLFKDAEHTSLADAVDQAAIDAAQADVDQVKDAAKKAELQKEVDKAQALLDARNAVNDIFTDANHNAVKPETTQAVVDGLKDQVAKLPEGADKAALVAQLDKAQAMLDGQKAVDNIFTDATKTAVKPEMTNKDIDDAKALIDKMPEGPAKEAALKDVEKAQGLVDVNNQTGAKTSVDQLFKDAEHTSLADAVDQAAIDAAKADVDQVKDAAQKAELQKEVDKAQALLDARNAVNGIFTDANHNALTPETTQAVVDGLKDQVAKLPEGADKAALVSELDKAQALLDGQKAVDNIFTDATKTAVKPEMTNKDIDDAKALIDKMPEGPAKEAALKDVEKAQGLVDVNNQTGAKTSVDQLFKDAEHTSLADAVDQAAIDAAQADVDQVKDAAKKAELQKEVDKAQALLDARNAVNGIFTDANHNALTPETTQAVVDGLKDQVAKLPEGADKAALVSELEKAQALLDGQKAVDNIFTDATKTAVKPEMTNKDIDDAKALIDKMPEGPAKEAALKDVEKAQGLVDVNNQTGAKTSVDQLFKDAEHTSLADAVDQAAIDAAKADVDQVKDAAKKAELQKEVDKAQALLDARNAVNGIFTDANHNALTPETTQAVVDGLKDQVAKLPEGADKAALVSELDKAQALLDGQKAVDNIFTDATKTAVKPEMTNKDIDDAKALIDKMPEGPAKEAALKDVEKAQGLVDVNNQTGAKTSVDQLFKDAEHTSLADAVDQAAIDAAKADVDQVKDAAKKAELQKEVDKAQALLDARNAVDGIFTDANHNALTPETTQAVVDGLKDQVAKLPEGADKAALVSELEKAQALLDGQKAVDNIFTDATKTAVKPEMTNKDIDDAKALIDKMPEGPAKEAALKDVEKAQGLVDVNNQTGAKTSVDQLFKDAEHTSLADAVDQAAIDAAKADVDQVKDAAQKAELQKEVDKAQALLDTRNAVNGIFTDANHNALTPETTQAVVDGLKDQVAKLPEGADKAALVAQLEKAQALLDGQKAVDNIFTDATKTAVKPEMTNKDIDDAKALIDKMPEGPAKEAALKDVEKAQGLVDVNNQTGAKTSVDQLFKDAEHTSLADAVDQAAIDAAKADVDQVKDAAQKAELQKEVDKAQALLDARNAVNDIFTDANHNAVKPETTQAVVDGLKDQVAKLPEGADKAALVAQLDKAQAMLDGQKAVDNIFTDATKTAVKPEMTHQNVDDAKAIIEKMPEGPAKVAAQQDLEKAKDLVEANVQAKATELVNQLYKDATLTSLAEGVDQAKLDAAQEAVSEIRDAVKKEALQASLAMAQGIFDLHDTVDSLFTDAKQDALVEGTTQDIVNLLKDWTTIIPDGDNKTAIVAELDKAQTILDGQKAVAELFADAQQTALKPEVNAETIAQAQAVVAKMPEGAAKEKALTDIAKAKELLEIRHQKEAQDIVNKLFTDATQTSLAATTDHAAIALAYDAVSKVGDATKYETLVKEIEKAEAILDARDAVNGIFTEEKHNALHANIAQADVDSLNAQVAKLPEGADKAALVAQLDKAQAMLDGQKAVDNIFTDANQTAVKPEMTNKDIEAARDIVAEMPEGPAKEAALQDLQKAAELVDFNNQQVAEDAIDRLYEDVAETSLADTIDQNSIDEAQADVDQVKDPVKKAELQKAIDKAQDLLDASRDVEALFNKGNHKDLKLEVTQGDIDALKERVNALPQGADQESLKAQLDQAQQLLDLKGRTESLFDENGLKPGVSKDTIAQLISEVESMTEGEARQYQLGMLDKASKEVGVELPATGVASVLPFASMMTLVGSALVINGTRRKREENEVK